MIKLTPEQVKARLADAYARVETMTRGELQAFCIWNDPNGCYTDSECMNEFGEVATTEELRAHVRMWRDDK